MHSTTIHPVRFLPNFLIFNFLSLSFLLSLTFCKIEKDNAPDGSLAAPSEQTFASLPTADAEKTRLYDRMHHSDFWFSGFYADANATLVVESKSTGTPSLLIGTYSRYIANPDPQIVKLKTGSNTITTTAGGLIYVRPNGSDANVKFVSGHKNAPYFKSGKTTEADWVKQLETLTNAPDVLLEGKLSMMVMSRQRAIEYKNEDHAKVLEAADNIINWEAEIAGLDGSKPEHQRSPLLFLMTETDGTLPYMYATSYRTAYSPDGCRDAFTKKIISDGWGPWHEIGHQHQQHWTWLAIGEVSVNIFSLQVERKFGITPSSLKRGDVWGKKMDVYFAKSDRNYNTDSDLGAFGRLCMFQQLWLAYGDTFFQKLHQKGREEKPSLPDDVARMRYFMLTSCKVSGNNLTVFFQKWGLPAPQSVYDEIAALNLPSPATEPSTLRE